MKVLFIDFKALQSYVLNHYFKGDWSRTESSRDEFGDRIIFALNDRPYLKYMLVDLKRVNKFVKFEYIYPWD
ncbi:hypothetical protein EHE19_018140 [Ruminiclostridium herbifermentans]|uniref:Uncharacterized protein n=1 Tax=Ruminiclostridium herbifermentans TaxID=2488810 RepID=A0A7H1VMX1_9FIRM|nr:hypothetical protein EHE19_018140 [Ruminiclostridium herbifermentans]